MIDKDKIIKEAIGEDFESIRYHDDCYITVRECKQIMDKLESKLKKLRVTDVSECVHPLAELVSGDEGLFCCKCQKYVRSNAHIR
jgi:hypothetical protein